MDKELATKSLDRNISIRATLADGSNDSEDDHKIQDISPEDPLAHDIGIISNLLKSLDAQGGGSGPITTLLGEMGIEKPDLG